ncbi:MAG: trypsin-like serine protease [Myxococcales bacterium]|nr:trypsin-like serine protease [Myxococcales bacterium]
MSKAARASAGLCVVIAVIACASVEDRAEPIGDRGDAIINGTAITDPVQVETSKNVHMRVVQGGAQCSQGSGTLLTNDWVLTAWHVVRNDCNPTVCLTQVQPNEIDVTLGDITLGHQSRKPDRFVLHPRAGAHNCFGNPDTDIALVHLASPFSLEGSTAGHFRPITDLETPNLLQKGTTCLGYGRDALCGSAGPPLRLADFVVQPYPPPSPYTTLSPASIGFTVMKGGGVTHDDLGTGLLPYKGDSGGPCIDPNDPIKGKEDVLGVIQSVDGDRGFTCPSGASELDPRFTRIVAASAFRDFARAVLASAMPPVQMDINFDGHLDTFFIKELAGHLFVEVQLGGPGGVVFTLPPTGIPKILPAGSDRAMIQHGDFDKDGIQDLFAYINGVPLYLPGVIGFNPATPVPTNLSLVSSYQYVAPRDVNKDGTDDLVAVQSDGTEHIYLGQAGKGLTSAAHLFPRGFRFFEPDDEESFAISAPSFSKKLSFSTPGSIKATKGLVYLVSKDADGTLYKDELDLNLDGEAGLPTPEAADAYGFAMAWGNFSKSASGLAELVTGAPGRAVGTVKNAGVVQWMRYNPAKSTAPFVDSKSVDRATFGEKPSQWAGRSSRLPPSLTQRSHRQACTPEHEPQAQRQRVRERAHGDGLPPRQRREHQAVEQRFGAEGPELGHDQHRGVGQPELREDEPDGGVAEHVGRRDRRDAPPAGFRAVEEPGRQRELAPQRQQKRPGPQIDVGQARSPARTCSIARTILAVLLPRPAGVGCLTGVVTPGLGRSGHGGLPDGVAQGRFDASPVERALRRRRGPRRTRAASAPAGGRGSPGPRTGEEASRTRGRAARQSGGPARGPAPQGRGDPPGRRVSGRARDRARRGRSAGQGRAPGEAARARATHAPLPRPGTARQSARGGGAPGSAGVPGGVAGDLLRQGAPGQPAHAARVRRAGPGRACACRGDQAPFGQERESSRDARRGASRRRAAASLRWRRGRSDSNSGFALSRLVFAAAPCLRRGCCRDALGERQAKIPTCRAECAGPPLRVSPSGDFQGSSRSAFAGVLVGLGLSGGSRPKRASFGRLLLPGQRKSSQSDSTSSSPSSVVQRSTCSSSRSTRVSTALS